MPSERISLIFVLRAMLLSFNIGFSLANAAVICAIPKRNSDVEPLSVTVASAMHHQTK